MTMNTAQAVANVALVYAVAIVAGTVCAFLSALFFPLLRDYRKELLHQLGAQSIFDMIRLAWRGQVRKRDLLFHCFLLAIQLCLLSSILLSVLAAPVFPPVLVSLGLGYLGSWCLTKLPAAYFAPAAHVILDKTVFITIHICCCLMIVQFVLGYRASWLGVNYRLCVGVVFGCLMNYVLRKGAHKVVILLVFCLMCSYVVYRVMVREREMGLIVAVCLFGGNMCIGLLVGRGLVVRTNYIVSIVCSVFGWLIWLSFTQIILSYPNIIAFRALWVKLKLICVEMAHFCAVLKFMQEFLVDRGLSNEYLFHLIVVTGIVFNSVLCKLIQLV